MLVKRPPGAEHCVLMLISCYYAGFVQIIESMNVADVLDKESTIQNYFRKVAPCEGAMYGIQPEVMDNYIKSCASYCVVTYLLGVGDRHLDNLLLTNTGRAHRRDITILLDL